MPQPNQPQNSANFQQQRQQQHQANMQARQPVQEEGEEAPLSHKAAKESTPTLSVVDQFTSLAAMELKAVIDKTSNMHIAKEAITKWWSSLSNEERANYRQEVIEKARYVIAQVEEVLQDIPILTMV